MENRKVKLLSKISKTYLIIGISAWVIAIFIAYTQALPIIWYTLYPQSIEEERTSLTQNINADVDGFADIRDEYEKKRAEKEASLPPYDPNLTTQNTIKIGAVGIISPIYTGEDWEKALDQGTWIVNDMGTPEDQFAPVVLAAHRYGAIGWTVKERNLMSFYYLPDVKDGDTVEIIWGQRSYLYQIYDGEENTEITDYNADLILYTCKLYWESPIRIFKYAKRIN